MTAPRALRGRLLDFTADPAAAGAAALRLVDDGILVMEGGRITRRGPAADLLPTLGAMPLDDHSGKLILPGFIDLHIHYPQSRVIAAFGTQLMDWLERYTFPEESRLADPAVASAMARFFIDELLANGTTTAVVYGTVHAAAADAFFEASAAAHTRMIAGKSMMDRNAPTWLTDTAKGSYDSVKDLITRWHGNGRQLYAVTPRFAITSTDEQMEACAALMQEHEGVYLQTHLSENDKEIAFVRELYPWARNYADVYRHFGVMGPRSLFGHSIHLDDSEVAMLADSGSIAVFCPTSNTFLGSGLFDRDRLAAGGVRIGLATDVGGGTSYSMLATAGEAYKVLQLRRQTLRPLDAFHMMTRGNAEVLGLTHEIGTLDVGSEADVVILDARATPAMAHRMTAVEDDIEQELFVLMIMGDDRSVAVTYVAGERAVRPR
ncbi:guanine deaminase [Zavarzinia aquatilis]|uniref:Guanine deaminase n=1 Tax=Zavarzinia aquatilis TaxID=2211142 RepID=A0A317EFN5_9PROT|nr:guanine deaminase [Zavarzinia aquatilis]PWR25412.1 guanine deaminase [Zavarzinia aquatilis]